MDNHKHEFRLEIVTVLTKEYTYSEDGWIPDIEDNTSESVIYCADPLCLQAFPHDEYARLKHLRRL